MNEQQLINTVRLHLDQGLETLPVHIQQRLGRARQNALAGSKTTRNAHSLAILLHGWMRPALAAMALILTVGLTTSYLQGQDEIRAMATLDSDLLTDDLPPDAFTDPGFRAWLEESSEG